MENHFRARALVGLRVVILAVMLSAASPKAAEAGVWCWLFGLGCGGDGTTDQNTPQSGAPEIDPGALAGAIALGAGGTALLLARVRRRRSAHR